MPQLDLFVFTTQFYWLAFAVISLFTLVALFMRYSFFGNELLSSLYVGVARLKPCILTSGNLVTCFGLLYAQIRRVVSWSVYRRYSSV